MAHMLEDGVNGVARMAFLGETPWHGLGVQVDESVGKDLDLFMEKAQMNVHHEKVPLFTEPKFDDLNATLQSLMSETDMTKVRGKLSSIINDKSYRGQRVDRYAVRRVEDGKIVGNVGPRYTLLQNKEAFDWFKPFIESGEAILNTAGTLDEGAKVWVLAKLNKAPIEITKNDVVDKFLLLSHSHDGSLAVRVGYTPVRVVCYNTLSMAHSSDASKLIRIRHSKNVKINLENIRDIMNLANQEFEATAEQYRLLVRKDINQQDLQKYVKQVFKLDELEDKDIDWGGDGHNREVISTRQKNILERVVELAETGKGNDLPGVSGTLWAAYNAVTEYLSYESGNSSDNRLSSLWYGQAANMNRHALDVALSFVNAA